MWLLKSYLISMLAEKPSRKIILIDACFSGLSEDVSEENKLTRLLKNQHTVIFTSSQKNERSFEGGAAFSYSFFTDALITGINSEAAVNNEVKMQNLGDYVFNKVKTFTSGMQNPYVYVPEGGNYVVAVR